jgi:hypothetical protein
MRCDHFKATKKRNSRFNFVPILECVFVGSVFDNGDEFHEEYKDGVVDAAIQW